jgi:hypothetical protein
MCGQRGTSKGAVKDGRLSTFASNTGGRGGRR